MKKSLEENRVFANEKFKKKFVKSFNSELKRLGIETADIQKKCGYSAPQIGYWLRGIRVPSARNLSVLWKAFPDLDMNKLLK